MISFLWIAVALWILHFGWIISIRSSVDKKDNAYVKKYLWSFPAMLVIWIIFAFPAGHFLSYFLVDADHYVMTTISLSFFLMGWITLFFFVESGRSIKEFFQSFLRMFIFFVFNLPGLAIFILVSWVSLVLDPTLHEVSYSTAFGIAARCLQLFVYMIFICALYNYFLKRFHDHSELYF